MKVRTWRALVVAALVVVLSESAWGSSIPVGRYGTVFAETFDELDVSLLGWTLGEVSDPIALHFAFGAGPWHKPLSVSHGFDWFPVDDDLTNDPTVPTVLGLDEHLLISGGRAWEGWVESEFAGGWIWDDGTLGRGPRFDVMLPGSSVFVPAPGLVVTNWFHHIEFAFDPLPAGTQIHLRTDLVFVGGDLVTGSVPVQSSRGVGSAQVLGSPTVAVPGPGAWRMGVVMLLGTCARRRR
ncbi:MAG: hypothetical protein CMJ49_11095 [Planctomycetaceae bacterium]|nr:hypothetical protein [Planctomycetaceae bacterium]